MRIKSLLFTILITLSGLFLSCTNNIDYEKEEEQIREVWNKISEYGPKGDWENYKRFIDHSEKIQVIHPEIGEWLQGWNEVSPKYKEMLESGNTWIENNNELINVNISKGGNMAWANAIYNFSFKSDPVKKYNMWESVVFEKIDDKWKIVMLMASGSPENN